MSHHLSDMDGTLSAMLTASALFADYAPSGQCRCWYCGAACDDTHPVSTWVKGNCTTHQYAAAPASPAVCAGCVATLDERATIHVADEPEPREGKRVRNFCWVVTSTQRIGYTKAHVEQLRAILLDPPPPPYCVVLTSSGQKHLLYRAPVVADRESPAVLLDEDEIYYTTEALADRLRLAAEVSAAAGKPALSYPPSARLYLALHSRHGDPGIAMADEWARSWCEPLSRLAAWLAPPKEQAHEYLHAHTAAIP